MSLLHHVIKSTTTSTLLRGTPRHFSTATGQPPFSDSSSIDPFLQDGSGLAYGKLLGVRRHTLKSDIINYFDGSDLRNDDIKVSYTSNFTPLEMLIKFPSRDAYNAASRVVGRKGRIYRLERAERSQWDILMPYDGRTVLLQGLPRSVTQEDIERFLGGCEYDSSSMQIMNRPGFQPPIKVALVRFPSRIAASNAFITKNRGFCLNNQITVRVLE